MMNTAAAELIGQSMVVTEKHMKSSANAEAEDMMEVSGAEGRYKPNEIIEFMLRLVSERENLTDAISREKRYAMPGASDIDAALEANKFRRIVKANIDRIVSQKEGVTKRSGFDYKMNVDGNQTQYYYPVEVTRSYNFDKDAVKNIAKAVAADLDKASVCIESGLVNSTVNYEPVFDVNGTFEDAMEVFVNNQEK